MKKSITLNYLEFESKDQLSAEWTKLLQLAKNATQHSHAPYSNYFVGCSLQLESGEIVLGYNQENVAFPSGLCAERVALFKYGTEHSSKIRRMAVTARSAHHITSHPITSCGGCLQVMVEFEKQQKQPISVLFAGETGVVQIFDSVKDLIPFAFEDPEFEK
jgi:cytidine deaminase